MRHAHGLLNQIDRCGLEFFASFHIPCIAPHFISAAQECDLDDMDARWTQQDHWHHDATLTKRQITDEGIALFQLPVKEGNDGLLTAQFVGPTETILEHTLNALNNCQFTVFIKQWGFINDFHNSYFCSH